MKNCSSPALGKGLSMSSAPKLIWASSCMGWPFSSELAIYAQRADSSANDRSFVFEEAFRETVKKVMGVDMGERACPCPPPQS